MSASQTRFKPEYYARHRHPPAWTRWSNEVGVPRTPPRCKVCKHRRRPKLSIVLACCHTPAASGGAPSRYIEPGAEENLLKIKAEVSRRLARETELVTAEQPGKQQPPEKLAIFHTAASEGATATTMSLGSKSFPARQAGGGDGRDDGRKQPRYGRCFSGMELRIGPGPLKDMDPGRLKGQIRKWARAVVAYARQISFGSPRSRPASSPTTVAKSGLGGAGAGAGREDPPT